MTDKYITYRTGYKYQLAEDYHVETAILPINNTNTQFIKLDLQGNLTVKSGYAWDGPSGPVRDTKKNLRASLVHGAFYQLMRKAKVNRNTYKNPADKLFEKMCVKDGVARLVAKGYYIALKEMGWSATDPANAKKPRKAPR